jgi:hypothetical protein
MNTTLCYPEIVSTTELNKQECRSQSSTMNIPESSACCSNQLCNNSPAAVLHIQLDQMLLFYATTDVLLDYGPVRSETCTCVVCCIGLSAYRAVNILHFGYKTNLFMFYKVKVAVCSEIRTKHINAMWASCGIF